MIENWSVSVSPHNASILFCLAHFVSLCICRVLKKMSKIYILENLMSLKRSQKVLINMGVQI